MNQKIPLFQSTPPRPRGNRDLSVYYGLRKRDFKKMGEWDRSFGAEVCTVAVPQIQQYSHRTVHYREIKLTVEKKEDIIRLFEDCQLLTSKSASLNVEEL